MFIFCSVDHMEKAVGSTEGPPLFRGEGYPSEQTQSDSYRVKMQTPHTAMVCVFASFLVYVHVIGSVLLMAVCHHCSKREMQEVKACKQGI